MCAGSGRVGEGVCAWGVCCLLLPLCVKCGACL